MLLQPPLWNISVTVRKEFEVAKQCVHVFQQDIQYRVYHIHHFQHCYFHLNAIEKVPCDCVVAFSMSLYTTRVNHRKEY